MPTLSKRFNFVELASSVGVSRGICSQKVLWKFESFAPVRTLELSGIINSALKQAFDTATRGCAVDNELVSTTLNIFKLIIKKLRPSQIQGILKWKIEELNLLNVFFSA